MPTDQTETKSSSRKTSSKKKVNKSTKIVIGTLLFLLATISGGYNFYLFKLHNYNFDYLKIDDCIEQEGCWDRWDRKCRPLYEPDAKMMCKRFKR